jgi:hypothetical protein
MAIANLNAPVYGIVGGDGMKKVHAPVNASFPITQGSLVYLDTSAHYIKLLDTDGHAATLMGVALQPSVVTSNLDNGSGVGAENAIMVGWDCVALLGSTAGDTYHYGDAVYVGADSQTVTNTVGALTKILGTVILPKGVSSVTGASGTLIQVLVKSLVL